MQLENTSIKFADTRSWVASVLQAGLDFKMIFRNWREYLYWRMQAFYLVEIIIFTEMA